MSTTVIPHRVVDAVNQVIKNEGLMNTAVNIFPYPDPINTFNSELYKATVVEKAKTGENTLNLYIKTTFTNASSDFAELTKMYFANEIFAYKELSKVIEELQIKAKVPEKERFKFVKYYVVDRDDVVILEDVTKKGYKVMKVPEITLQYMESVMETLARLHSLSFVLQKEKPEMFEKKIKILKRAIKFDDENFIEFLTNMTKKAENALDSADAKQRFKNFTVNVSEKLKKYFDDTSSRVNVMCHGNFRAGNMVYKEADGVVTEVIPVDYQQPYYGNPFQDMMYFHVCDIRTDFRKKHMIYLKDYYYDSMKKYLQYFKIDMEDVYPKNDFEEDFKSRLPYMLLNGIMALPFHLASPEETPAISGGLGGVEIPSGAKYINGMRLFVDEFIELGVL